MELALGFLAFGAALAAGVMAVRLAAVRARNRRMERDIRALEERIQELEQDLRRAREATVRFLGSVTHELRTPLTAIMGYQELLADGLYGEMDDRSREPVMRIGSAAADLLRMVDAALELARLDAGRIQLRLAPVEVAAACRAAAETLADMARDRNTRIDIQVPDDLPTLTTDPQRLASALELTLTGAVHASPGETVTIRARASRADVLVDIGGVPPPAEGWTPALDSLASLGGSAAFRFSLAQRFLRALGGDVELTSAQDAPTLRLRLPTAAPPPAEPVPAPEAGPATSGSRDSPGRRPRH